MVINTISRYNISGIGVCFLFVCIYSFVAIAKVSRGDQLSCLFLSAEEHGQVNQALEMKKTTNCQIRRLNRKTYVSFRDSNFVVRNNFEKERV